MHNILETQQLEISKYFTNLHEQFNTDQELNDRFMDLIETITATYTLSGTHSGAIYFTGIGKNDTIAKKSANMLRSLNFNAHHLNPVDAMHGDMGVINDNDTIIAISKSGNTGELVHFLNYVKNFRILNIYGIQIGEKRSKFFETCNYVFTLPEVTELDEWSLVPTMSNITTQLFIDYFAMSASRECTDLTKELFVQSHPGGAIGQTKI